MKTYTTSLFIFRRDLRLTDNTGLNNALANSTKVIPCFIFDPHQIEDVNKYKSKCIDTYIYMYTGAEGRYMLCLKTSGEVNERAISYIHVFC